ncbi:protein ripply2 [Heterocephalus glaber]|uniref:Protein ripply2 n=1 Tax=Heterocephalus glaber TaxID=10181 RepID=A0AAX6R1I7_HETGA|nr:protein ripply2 [Heterocephalus glaber]
MLFFTTAMCGRAINTRSTKPLPRPFGSCTLHTPEFSSVRLHAQPFCLCEDRGAERVGTFKYAGGRKGYIKPGAQTVWKRARLSASWERPSAEPRQAMENAESAGSARCRPPPSQVPDRPTQCGAADSGSAGFWRPWEARGEREEQAPRHPTEAMPGGQGMTAAPGKLSQYRHPVRKSTKEMIYRLRTRKAKLEAIAIVQTIMAKIKAL